MKKVGICGNFGGKDQLINGQTIKTNILYTELSKIVGEANINIVDTFRWNSQKLKLFINCLKIIRECEHIVILPAHNGIKVILPLFLVLNMFYKKMIHYVVIGGWLPELVEKKLYLRMFLRKLQTIFVETISMKDALNSQGLNNVYHLPNFKSLESLKIDDLTFTRLTPYKLCTFSRVSKQKGIENAIKTVNKINNNHGETIYTLDIYGPIEEGYEAEFSVLVENDKNINYKGIVSHSKSVEVLKDYYLLLFPTFYEGEGFAGTLLDAFAAGLPVIASNWKYNSEIIESGKTGLIFELDVDDDFEKQLEYAFVNSNKIDKMRLNCIREYQRYKPENVIRDFITKAKIF